MQHVDKTNVRNELLVVTGMSGAGKSVALQALEDLGYFCVDNLPPILLQKFVDLMDQGNPSLSKVAIGIDLRGKDFFDNLRDELDYIQSEKKVIVDILFLEASDEKLISRYKETRRTHPLSEKGSLLSAIEQERELLSDVKGISNFVIDTTEMKPKVLIQNLVDTFEKDRSSSFQVRVLSFGFKHGMPIDADIVIDVRFLPNPYYVEELRPLTGLDDEVYQYVMKWKETVTFYKKFSDLLMFMLPGYKKEGKSLLTIAIGCTGGQHRSVALAKRIGEDIRDNFDYAVYTSHRDAHIESKHKI
ncbi:RNase adapter RapZ [Mammaliicoccus stepanovicii]|uniref:GlmZ(SRNA)-inactivating NTPase n=1 Tax=Mammaliicoccus stepanovicii TaxID=643214 RepID=A0A239ZXW5_9STAP|nr:RNase adapter RapZ [Mammaliicoccus stepanovicii]PNZ79302.1 RNase adapter RapZ [Mammaliicoccus stepanovicii]GGI39199.1 nucleotide-binding protein [Mammaliicoccus stepanovicii]SNV75710.1 glmZ(sRNA)-inactivating NTPase [Mammaliicoccus stepanovicii]